MPEQSNNPLNFWEELKRRRVIRVIPVYAAAAFVLLELVDIIAEPFGLPGWTLKLVFVLLCIGFVISVILSWVYDVTPEGVQKTKPAGKIKEQPGEKPVYILRWKITTYVSIVVIIGLLAVNIFSGRKQANDYPELERSIAVLPFENLSRDEEQSWFSDGITDVIINQLSKISDLRVLSRTSTLKYKEERKLIPEIGEELGVNYIMEGTVQREGDQVRISIQLIRAMNEDHLWSELYDREYRDLFTIQSEIAQAVASELEAIITPQEKQLIEKVPTTEMTAFDYHLKAIDQYYSYIFTREKSHLDSVVHLAHKSLALDPEFALAYYWLGNSSLGDEWLSTYYKPFYLDSALIYFNKALELDSNLVEAYVGRGTYYYERAQRERATDDLKAAIRLDPNYATAYTRLGMICFNSRDYVEALINFRKAEILEKGDRVMAIQLNIWWIYVSVGDLEKAELYLQEKLGVDLAFEANWWILEIQGRWEELLAVAEAGIAAQPEDWGSYYLKSTALLGLGRIAEAEECRKNGMQYSSIELMNNNHHIGNILWANGKKDEAMEYFNKQIIICEESIKQRNQYGITLAAYDLASVYAFLGNREEAMKWLREYENLGFTNGTHEYIKVDPLFDNLRDDEEFKEIVKRANDEKAEIRIRINRMEEQGLL